MVQIDSEGCNRYHYHRYNSTDVIASLERITRTRNSAKAVAISIGMVNIVKILKITLLPLFWVEYVHNFFNLFFYILSFSRNRTRNSPSDILAYHSFLNMLNHQYFYQYCQQKLIVSFAQIS